jgi:tyrosyl-tRNA synthetase
MKPIDILCRNAVDVIDRADLEKRLESGKPLRVKAGFDPIAPDIHLGHTVLLRKLREFQDLGHKVILLIGDTTAKIGDPTGQSKTRPVLTTEQVEVNAKTYQDQAFKILDKDPQKIEVVYNSKWLDTPEMLKTFLSIAGSVTVDQLLVRDDFDKRRKARRPIALQEMFYPIMQGYDSVAVKADVELGGTDQLFNLLMGREIQSLYKMRPQVVMTMPLLVGLDGTMKMSKSLGNYIAVNDSPKDVFGKAMSIPDELMETYFNLLTSENGTQIAAEIRSGQTHPRDAKTRLASNIVSFFHGQEAAEREVGEFDRVFRDKLSPENPEEVSLESSEIWVVDLLKKVGAVSSGGDARRLIEQGAVTLDNVKINDSKAILKVKHGSHLKAGKKKFVRLVLS